MYLILLLSLILFYGVHNGFGFVMSRRTEFTNTVTVTTTETLKVFLPAGVFVVNQMDMSILWACSQTQKVEFIGTVVTFSNMIVSSIRPTDTCAILETLTLSPSITTTATT